MVLQRLVQALSLLLFLVLLWLATFPLISPFPVDFFLRTDPMVMTGTWLSARALIPALGLAAVLLALTWMLGRFFCGMLCPMGTTIDVSDRWIRGKPPRKSEADNGAKTAAAAVRMRPIKYYLLCFVLGAAVFGVSLVFLAAPIPLITRFYGLLIFPAMAFLAESGLVAIQPAADFFDMTGLVYAQVEVARFALQWFTVLLFGSIFALAVVSPRFWCRNLCPAGGLFAVFSRKPLIRRRVSEDCIHCGKCQKACPMAAIPEDPLATVHEECIVCETCVRICPVEAVRFAFTDHAGPAPNIQPVSRERRRLMLAGAAGAGAAIVSITGLNYRPARESTGKILHAGLIRPPGALPEHDFLTRCIRCGECMKVCPTNTLQPIGLTAGFYAFFSPRITPRRGPCEPLCNGCGQVCPTGAIRPLPPEEKQWAKVGTAYVLRHKCLAWEFDRECLVCDEVCPYNAIDLKSVEGGSAPVPFIYEHRCSGCGFCEHHCPVQAESAIVVEPMEALRLAEGSYRETARAIGLELRLSESGEKEPAPGPYGQGTGPETGGFDSEGPDAEGLPPGFTE
jgi:MauM/NapG family ferredoxin protein